MTISDRYQGAQRDVGENVLPLVLQSFFATRKAANAEANTTGADPRDLAKMEMSAREALAKMQNQLAQSKTSDRKGASDALTAYIAGTAETSSTDAKSNADVTKARVDLQGKYAQAADEAAAKIEAASAYSVEGGKTIDSIAESVRTGLQNQRNGGANLDADHRAKLVSGAVSGIQALLGNEKAGGFGDAKADNIVHKEYQKLLASGVPIDIADDIAKSLQPNARNASGEWISPSLWMATKHGHLSPQEAAQMGWDVGKKYGGGGAQRAFNAGLKAAGINPSMFGTGEGESTTTGTSTSGGGSVPVGGSLAASGLSPQAVAKVKASVAAGADPYQALLDGVAEQHNYVNGLEAQRQDALTHRSFPRANPYVSNPNTAISDDYRRAALRAGESDPMNAEMWANGLAQNHGNVERTRDALAADGGVDGMFSPSDSRPEIVNEGGDLGDYLAGMIENGPKSTGDVQDNGWAYRFGDDGTITVTAAPKGHKPGAVLKPGDKGYDAIRSTATASEVNRILGAQPADVQELFDGVRKVAATDPKGAAKLARNITSGQTRAAYGAAMARSGDSNEELSKVAAGLNELPEAVKGPWSEPIYNSVDFYHRTKHMGGAQAEGKLRGDVSRHGEALMRGAEGVEQARNHAQSREDLAFRAESSDEPAESAIPTGYRDAARAMGEAGRESVRTNPGADPRLSAIPARDAPKPKAGGRAANAPVWAEDIYKAPDAGLARGVTVPEEMDAEEVAAPDDDTAADSFLDARQPKGATDDDAASDDFLNKWKKK